MAALHTPQAPCRLSTEWPFASRVVRFPASGPGASLFAIMEFAARCKVGLAPLKHAELSLLSTDINGKGNGTIAAQFKLQLGIGVKSSTGDAPGDAGILVYLMRS